MIAKRLRSWIGLFLISIVLSACGSGGGSGVNTVSQTVVSGIAQKGGFVSGSTVSIFQLVPSSAIRTGNLVTTKTTDNQGSYTAVLPWNGWLEVEITGKYFDEVTGNISDSERTLSAIGLVNNSEFLLLNVNAFTDVSVDRIRSKVASGSDIATADESARDEVKALFDLESNNLAALDVTNGAGTNQNDNAKLLLFSGAVLSAGVTEEEWDQFTENNDQDVFNKIGNAVQNDPDLLSKLENNINAFISENGIDNGAVAPSLIGSSLGSDSDWVNKLPTVSVSDLIVNEQTTVTLTDNQSASDIDGTIVSYLWAQTGGETVALTGVNSNESSFTAPTRLLADGPATLSFSLTVTDDRGGVFTEASTVTVNPVNATPVAEAGNNQTVNEQTPVTLSASNSADTDGSISTYSWAQTSGKTVTLDTDASSASFTSPVQLLPEGNGTLTFEVTVTDNEGISHTDTVDVTVQPVNLPPVPNAGADQTFNEQTSVTLSASDSADADGSVATYAWTQTAGKTVALNNPAAENVSFTTPVQLLPEGDGGLTFEVTVTDNEGVSRSDSVEVIFKPVNLPPVANAGADQSVDEQTLTSLSAAASTDADGSVATYAWTQTAGKAVTLDDASAESVNFTTPVQLLPDGPHVLTFEVEVTDNEGVSHTDTVDVTVNPVNATPVAIAGDNQNVDEQTLVTLDASQSSDEDGEVVTYSWKQVDELGKIVEITNASSAVASFTTPIQLLPDGEHVLTFELTVTDDEGTTHTDTVIVTVNPVNATPVANSGADQTSDEQSIVTLNAAQSSDEDGEIVAYAWNQIDELGKTVEINNASSPIATFTTPVQLLPDGSHVLTFELTVTDNEGTTHTDTIDVTVEPVNLPPVANAGIDKSVDEQTLTSLSAAASNDADGNIVSYSWTQTAGNSVTLDDASADSVSFTTPVQLLPDGPHTLTFEVEVTDNEGVSHTDTVNVIVNPVNIDPVANAGVDQSVNEQSLVTLSAAASSDADGTIASYAWTQTVGKTVTLDDASAESVNFTTPIQLLPDGPHLLTFEVTVTDNEGVSHTDTVNVTVNPVNLPPVANAGDNQIVEEQTSVTLSSTGSADEDGTIAAYAWKQVDELGKTVVISDANSPTASFVTPVQLLPDGDHVLTFELTVTDNEGIQNTDTVIVTVQPVNIDPVANAGDNQSVDEQTVTSLSAAASADEDGTIVSYAWTQTSGKTVSIVNASSSTASFTSLEQLLPDGPETLTFELTVTDNEGVSNTDTVDVVVNPVNIDPVSEAGDNQDVNEQSPVFLSASASNDADGSIASYAWTQTAGKTVALSHSSSETTSFVTPIQLLPEGTETLTFELTVTDNEGVSHTDTVDVVVNPVNIDPVSEAGDNQNVNEQSPVTLSAAASSDEDGTIASYAWTQTSGKDVTLDDATAASVNFTTPEQLLPDGTETLTFEVTVTDNEGVTHSDTVDVVVNPVNIAPVAEAGDNQNVNEQLPVTLSAAASSDEDGTIASYAWTQTSGKDVTLDDATAASVNFTTPEQLLPDGTETLTFEVTVTDNEGVTHSDTVDVVVNPVNIDPVANAGVDQSINEQTPVALNAEESSDEDGSIASYAWTQTAGKDVTLSGDTSKFASFTAPVQLLTDGPHTLTFKVEVTDNEGVSHSDTVNVVVNPVNALPVANAGANQGVNEKLLVTLDASASLDSDPPSGIDSAASIKSYRWEQVVAGDEATPVLSNAFTKVATFTAPTRLLSEGEEKLTFKVTVTDHENESTSDTVEIRVTPTNTHPVAEAGDSQSVHENEEVTLSAVNSSDVDGDIVDYKWEQTFSTENQVAVTLNDDTSIAPVFVSPVRSAPEGIVVLTFKLTVTDNEGYTHEDTTIVTVNPDNAKPIANAGINREVDEQTVVQLNGSASDDPDGEIVTYTWVQTAGDSVSLSATDQPEITFTAPVRLAPQGTETLSFQLTVKDDENAVDVTTVDIIVKPVNILPKPLVGADQTVNEGTVVSLTSSASTDEDSTDPLSHQWRQVSGEPITLIGSDTATPSFTAPAILAEDGIAVSETLLFEVTVTDNEEGANEIVESNSDHRVAITVTSVNVPPVSVPGNSVAVDSESFVELDGSGSTDSDGNIISYLWEQKTGTSVALSANDVATVNFTLPRIIGDSADFSFDLTVTDNEGYSHTQSVVITANPASVGYSYLKGQLIEGATTFTPYSDLANVAYTTTSKDHPETLSLAGQISVTEGGDDALDDNELYIIQVSMGSDIDHDLNAERDISPTSVSGMMRSIMTGADLKNDNWTITPLTEIAYQQASSLISSGASVAAIQEQLDNTAKQLLADDLTADTIVNRHDLYAYIPSQNQGSLKLSSVTLATLIDNIIAGESTLTASLDASKQVITTRSLFGGDAHSTAIKGDYAYVAAGGHGLMVVDISNANDLSIVGQLSVGSFAHDIEITGNYAYIATSAALVVANIGNPTTPVSQKTLAISGDSGRGVTLNNGFAYVAAGNGGLLTYNISDAANPSYLGQFTTSGPANDVIAVVDTAYVAIGTGGLEVVDVTSKTIMSKLDTFNTTGTAKDLVIDGSFAYVADGEKGLQVINIGSIPLTLEAELSVPGNTTGIKKIGNSVYLASDTSGIHLVDVSDPADPSVLNTVTTSSANDLTLLNDIAYVSDGSVGLTLVDVSSLSSLPHVLKTIKTAGNHVDSVATLSDLAVTGISIGGTGVESYNLTDESNPVLSQTALISKPVLDTDTDGTYAFAAVGEDGVKIVKLSDGVTSTYDTTGVANAVKVSGNYVYVADGSAGFKILDVSNSASPAISGQVDTSGEAVDIALSSDGNYAFVADSIGGVHIISINDKANPEIVNSVTEIGLVNGVYLNNNTLYVATSAQGGLGIQGIQMYDASTGGALAWQGNFVTPNLAYSTVVKGNYAYISNESDGIQVVDITDKTSPIWTANIDTSGLAHDLALSGDPGVPGDYIYVADQHGGLSVIKSLAVNP